MGTTGEWNQVLVMGVLWGAGMLFFTGRRRWRKHLKPVVLVQDVLSLALWGLWFGTVFVFGWRRSFQMPLIVMNVGALVGALLVPLAFRISRKNGDNRSL